jgi:hypothetical protein
MAVPIKYPRITRVSWEILAGQYLRVSLAIVTYDNSTNHTFVRKFMASCVILSSLSVLILCGTARLQWFGFAMTLTISRRMRSVNVASSDPVMASKNKEDMKTQAPRPTQLTCPQTPIYPHLHHTSRPLSHLHPHHRPSPSITVAACINHLGPEIGAPAPSRTSHAQFM